VFVERTSVGLDVHARSVVAVGLDGLSGEVIRARLGSDLPEVLAWVRGLPGPVRVVYEAGPTGFGLARALAGEGIECLVAAPSKISRPAGDRVKTDARDAMLLARLLRVGDIVAVRVPTEDEEAARDLVRAREDVRGDLMRARHRLSKLLLRHGAVWDGREAWTSAHEAWLRRQAADFTRPGLRAAFDADHEAVLMAVARRDRLDAAIEAMAADSQFTPVVRRLGCLRGVNTLTAFGLATEIGDWQRFTGSTIGAYLGLTPSEYSSGASRVQGSITRTGNTHARRLLVEAAWHHRRTYRTPGATMQARWKVAPASAAARGHQGNQRLHARWQGFTARKKRPVVANVAVARELAGWCWSLAVLDS
jgi:transposase